MNCKCELCGDTGTRSIEQFIDGVWYHISDYPCECEAGEEINNENESKSTIRKEKRK
jgi:hypothetical protein